MTAFVALPGSTGPWRGGSVVAGAVCVLAPNPGPMTLDGTNTWVLAGGPEHVVIIDPGPPDPAHLARVREAVGDREVAEVLLTHGHLDHSEGAPAFARAFRTRVRALDPAFRLGDEGLSDGDVVAVGDLELRVIATPGHSADSLSFHVPAMRAVLTGDTILGRGTTVVAHPEGRLRDYLDSLQALAGLCESAGVDGIWPGHGPVLSDARAVIAAYLDHRRQRLVEVERAWQEVSYLPRQEAVQRIVSVVYTDVPKVLWPAAGLSVAAQVEYLAERQ